MMKSLFLFSIGLSFIPLTLNAEDCKTLNYNCEATKKDDCKDNNSKCEYSKPQYCCICPCDKGLWYSVVGTGCAFTMKAGIDNPDPGFWDPANEGYNDNLGYSSFFSLGFGRRWDCLYIDVGYTFFKTFHYQKHQTSDVAATPGFTGISRVRYFDLDVQNFMLNFTYTPCYRWTFCNVGISPLLNVGLGLGFNRLFNFHTVGFVSNDVSGFIEGSIGDPVTTTSFVAQGTAGLRFQPCFSYLSFDIAYRYIYGGRFRGPSSVLLASTGEFATGARWRGHLHANAFYLASIFSF